jgi:hypothetical protein
MLPNGSRAAPVMAATFGELQSKNGKTLQNRRAFL